ncbi:MAG: hypothetical protein WD184_01970 [Acidimicrobiia bacterium]
MTDRTALDRIADWVQAEEDLTLDDHGRIVVGDEMIIEVETDEDRLLLTHRSLEPVATPERIAELRSLLPGRATTMTGEVAPVESGTAVHLTNRVYLDGLNHQTFATALRDLVGAVDALAIDHTPHEPAEPVVAKSTAEVPMEPEPTRVMDPVWIATHAVPAGGMPAWPEPNPELQPTAMLEARVRLSIAERRGDWARVVGSNGWTGWVDARRIAPLAAAEPAAVTPATAGGSRPVNPLLLAGAFFTALSALLPWLQDGRNSMELTLGFLWDFEAEGAPYIGWVLIGLAALVLGTAFLKRPLGPAVLLGILTVAVAGLFVAQLYRALEQGGGGFDDLKEIVGWAPGVTLGAGILTLIGGTR